jgi:hypothetical protein
MMNAETTQQETAAMTSNEKLFQTMYNSTKEKLQFAIMLKGGDMQSAIEYAKTLTCAGPKIWDAVLAEYDAARN